MSSAKIKQGPVTDKSLKAHLVSDDTNSDKITKILGWAIVFIIAAVPFHAFFTTWLGSSVGYIDIFRIWKELLLVLITFGTLFVAYKDPKIKDWLVNSPLVLAILVYVLLHFATGIYALQQQNVSPLALIYGLIANLRFLVFFVVCAVVAYKLPRLLPNWPKFILIPATIVVVFGLLQLFVLPVNVLENFGYGQNTIPAYQTVDQKPEYARVQSTLRGANPLGAYLLVIITAIAGIIAVYKKYKINLLVFAAGTFLLLGFTYSRSAWLGVALALALLVILVSKNNISRRIVIMILTAVTLLGSLTVWAYKNNDILQNTLFHTDETSRSPESSNAVRTQAMLSGAKNVLDEPFGSGPGTAGPASFRNNKQARISENYFIQIAQEVGIIGLALFLYIVYFISTILYKNRKSVLPSVVLALLGGLVLVNMLSHAWTDDTIAYVFWGLAGIACAPYLIAAKAKQKA